MTDHAGSARELFVAAARGRASAAEVLAAVRGEASAAASAGPAPGRGPVWAGCPYLGLVPFQERDEQVFYGRGELVAQLVQRLARQLNGTGILLVAGESGAGKSSLLRAGLMPQLAAGALGPGSARWPRRVIQPTGSPLRELAMQLADIAGADPVSVYQSLSTAPGEAPLLVEHAVNRGAQAAYDALTGRPQGAARLVFTQLTAITLDGQFARRRCSRADLRSPEAETDADIDAVIDAFSGHRLGRLATVDAAALRWQDASTRYPPLSATTKAFLRAGHHAATRSARRRRAGIAGLVLLTVVAIGAAGIAVRNAASSTRQHAIAVCRQLAGESLALASTDFVTAGRLAVAAWSVFPTDQARSAMTAVLADPHPDDVLPGNPPVTGVAFSPDGRLLAAAVVHGTAAVGHDTVQLWDPAIDQAVGVSFPADTGVNAGGVNGMAFSPDGRLLAIANSDGTVRLREPATGRAVGVPIPADTGPAGGVNGVAFSPGTWSENWPG